MRKSKKNLPHGQLTGERLFRSIEAVCEGLIYTSETDAPVMPFIQANDASSNDVTPARPSEELIRAEEQRAVQAFFKRLTANRQWFGTSEKAMAAKFARLQDLLEENLTDLRIVRMGMVELTIVIVGRDHDGRLMGITTKAVET